jgi:DNA-binding MarR family transcriptional regulator
MFIDRSDAVPDTDLDALQSKLIAFVREFGLHRPDMTPCGVELSVSQAHAVTELDGGPIAQSELGNRLRLTKSTVSRLVGQLDERGWIARDHGESSDGRVVTIRLTTAGSEVAARIAEARRERMHRLLDNIPDTERDTVLRALDLLVSASRK